MYILTILCPLIYCSFHGVCCWRKERHQYGSWPSFHWTSVASGRGGPPRGATAGRAGGTATAEEVGVFTGQTIAHNSLDQHCQLLFVLQTNRKNNTDTTRATQAASMLNSNC